MAKDKSPGSQQRASSSPENDSTDRSRTKSPSPQDSSTKSAKPQGKNAAAAAAAAAASKKSRHSRHHGSGRSRNFTHIFQSSLVKYGLYFIGTVLTAIFGYYYYQNYIYLPSLVNTPSDLPKVLSSDHYSVSKTPDMFWGTYDANPYFAMRTRSRESPVVGVMWYTQPRRGEVIMPKIRHWAAPPPDNVHQYGWVEHDGRTFGYQQIFDDQLVIQTSFVKRPGGNHGGDWTARIDASTAPELESRANTTLYSVIIYVFRRGTGTLKPKIVKDGPQRGHVAYVESIAGETPELGKFQIRISPAEPDNLLSRSYVSVQDDTLHGGRLVDTILMNTGAVQVRSEYFDHFLSLMGGQEQEQQTPPDNPNFVALQITVLRGTKLDIIFESASVSDRPNRLVGRTYDEEFEKRRKQFDERFENLFRLKEKKYADIYIDVGKAALSNMLGSVSFFHGHSRVISKYNRRPIPYGPLTLFSTMPSRPFFPRGFLWDEGFHQLLISRWDTRLSLEILSSWLDLMNVEGWIPREVILGTEAESKVPAQYIVQHNDVANPPVFFYVINALMKRAKKADVQFQTILKHMYPRLKLWYQWLNTSQAGSAPNTYRWRGRNGTIDTELNPKTLPSGLDDYPRASHPTDDEYHVDLYCWMATASNVMAQIGELTGDSEMAGKCRLTSDRLHSFETLNTLHYSEKQGRYCDYGLHTRHVSLERPKIETTPDGRPKPTRQELVRATKSEPQRRLVNDVFGYVSLFPFIMRLIPSDSPKLQQLLRQLTDADLLWTPYGLRSLAKTSPWYNQRNTEHDPPYWRGAIWINLNYLVLSSLHHYSHQSGPYRELAFEVYGKLRGAVVGNIVKEYRRTGFLWEHYNDETGHGEGTHPFTGWTSLVVLMMAEEYD